MTERSPSSTAGGRGSDAATAIDLSVLLRQAEACERAGQLQEAERLYRELVRALPEHPGLLQNLALLLFERGQLAEAESLLRRALAADPAQADLHNSLGSVIQRQGRLQDAQVAYRKALELKPGHPDAHYNLGVLLEEAGFPDQALEEYRAALAGRPKYARALTRIGAILQSHGATEQALAEFDQAVQSGPHYFDAHYYRGTALSGLGRHDEALAALSRAEGLRPSSVETQLAIAHALQSARRNDQALAAYWRALELHPRLVKTHEELNTLAWSAGRRDLYLRSFEFARQRFAPDPELLQLEAAFLLRQDQLERAEELLWQAHQRAPQHADIMGLLARTLGRRGRFEEAYAYFARAIAAAPAVLLHRQELGFALLRDGQTREALDTFQQARILDPLDQITLAGLAIAYRQADDSRYQVLVDIPRYVRTYDIGVPAGFSGTEAFSQALAQELDALHGAKAEPIGQTLRGGTQTPGHLFETRTPCIQHLRQRIEAAVAEYIRELPRDASHPMDRPADAGFDFNGSWSCRLASQGYHSNHVHPKGWISSAYYVRLPQADQAQRHGWLKFGESNLGLGGLDAPESYVQPVPGRLVLFPSFYWHGTVPFPEQGDRLGVAFDVAPRAA